MNKTHTSLTIKLSLIAVLIACSGVSQAQWTRISTSSASIDLYDISFANDTLGYAVGRAGNGNGYTYKTTNGGATWQGKVYPATFFRSIEAVDANKVAIAGYDVVPGTTSLFFSSTNQGGSYTKTANNTYLGMEHLQFINSNDGFAVGYGGLFGLSVGVYKSSNGGTSWTASGTISGTKATDFHFVDANTGFISTAINSSSGSIYKSTNGGTTWSKAYTGKWISDVYFFNSQLGFALEGLSSTDLLKTTDGGTTWTKGATVGAVSQLVFLTNMVGYAVGKAGLIKMTVDGGATWTTETSAAFTDMVSIDFDSKYVYSCGDQGQAYRKLHGLTINSVVKNNNATIAELNLYPNPAKDFITVDLKDLRDVEGEVINMSGAVVRNVSFSDGSNKIDARGIVAGNYFLKLKKQGNVIGQGKFQIIK